MLIPPSTVEFVRKHQIMIFTVLILAVQCAAAWVVQAGWIRRGFFEWSFVCKLGIALMLIGITDGFEGLKRIGKSLINVNLNWRWYVVALFGMPLVLISTVYVHRALTGNLAEPVRFNPWSFTGWYPRMWAVMTLMAVTDEVAFFSFVYTRLAPRFTGIAAAVLTAAIWTLSYAPRLIMVSEMLADATMPYWVLGAFFFTVAPICAWVYGSTKSAFLVVLLQLIANFGTLTLPILPAHTGTNWVYLTQSALMAIVSLGLVLIYGSKSFKASPRSLQPA